MTPHLTPTVKLVTALVSQHCNLTVQELIEPGLEERICRPRALAMLFLKECGWSYKRIGLVFGKSKSSVIERIRFMRDRIDSDPEWYYLYHVIDDLLTESVQDAAYSEVLQANHTSTRVAYPSQRSPSGSDPRDTH